MVLGSNGFSLEIHSPDPTLYYQVLYQSSVSEGTPDGTVFDNGVTAAGTDFLEHSHEYQYAAGEGEGDLRSGEVSWQKTDPDASVLAGSEWELAGPNGSTVIIDNGSGDGNSAEGAITVTDLPWGEYRLVETKAPTGYLLDSTPYVFTISAYALTIDLGDIVNAVIPAEPEEPTEVRPPESSEVSSVASPLSSSTGSLANTGVSVGHLLVLAAMLLVGGTTGLVMRRRARLVRVLDSTQ